MKLKLTNMNVSRYLLPHLLIFNTALRWTLALCFFFHQMTTAQTILLPTKWHGCTATLIWSTRSGCWILDRPPSPWLLLWLTRAQILSRSTGCPPWEDHFIKGTIHCGAVDPLGFHSWMKTHVRRAVLCDSDIWPLACFSCMTCAVLSKSFSNL